jgi:hypothetical protein
MTVGLSEEARRRIIALVGRRRMAQFIREAVEAELRRRERLIEVASANGHTDADPFEPKPKRVSRDK